MAVADGPLAGVGYAAPSAVRAFLRLADGSAEASAVIAEETPIALVYNGRPHVVVMGTPSDLEDLAVGFTRSEGIAPSASDIERVDVVRASHGIELQIQVAERCVARLAERARGLVSRTGCGLCGIESIADALRVPDPVASVLRVPARALWRAGREMSDAQTLNASTNSVHAAGWATPDGAVRIVREDVGRHNALDKVIGALERGGTAAADGFLVVTSRASYEMVQKAASAGVELLAAVSRPTGLAIRFAESAGMTLVGLLRGTTANIYCGAERVSTTDLQSVSRYIQRNTTVGVTIVPSDIEIAQRVKMRPIEDVAAELGLERDELDLYGKYKAKISLDVAQWPARGRLVVVTATNPTPAGEGKSTVSVGLAQALRRMGKRVALCIREPSLGPVFGVKGGAAGGGYAQVVPMEDINLHFTGDFHAISSAHALLAAMIDNHLHQGNALGLDQRRIAWPRTIDMNDRALRNCVIGLGGVGDGIPREEHFVIVPASEIMAIVALATSPHDLEERLARIIVGYTAGAKRRPVTAGELRASGAMALLLKDAIRPNLVQTLEGGPAFVHAGPFGNIAHGCNSILATRSALALADIVVTEAGFGSDLGAEKFFDIKCRMGGLQPEAAVIVATVRSLKMHGGGDKKNLGVEDLAALERGLPNLEKHIENVRHFGVPSVVALNRRTSDTDAELAMVSEFASRAGVPVALTEVWEKGGAGGEALGAELLSILEKKGAEFRPLYPTDLPIKEKIDIIARQIYGADGADYTPAADRAIEFLESIGLGGTPICMAKTQYSLSDDASKLGRPRGFRISVNEVRASAGAGFVVAQCGDIMTMPGLPKEPAAERMARLPSGEIVGLF